MKSVFAGIALIMVIFVPAIVFALHDFDILNFDVDQIKADSDGRVFFIISIDIRNNNQPGKIVVNVIALDKEWNVIKSHTIRGDFMADQVRTLLLRTFLERKDYSKFGEWRIKRARKYRNN